MTGNIQRSVAALKSSIASQSAGVVLNAMVGKKVVFQGKFDRGERDRLAEMTEAQGGVVADELDAAVDYLVLADVAGGKGIQKQANSLNAKGAQIQILDRGVFTKMVEPTREQVLAMLRGGNANAKLFLKAFGVSKVVYMFRAQQTSAPLTIANERFDGLDLSGFRLHFVEFGACSFVGATLEGTSFHGATDCNFSDANLARGVLRDVRASRFCGAKLEGAQFYGRVDGDDFTNARMSNASFGQWRGGTAQALANPVRFVGATLICAVFRGSPLDGADFSGADLSLSVFNSCALNQANFSTSPLKNASFVACKLAGATFTGADLNSADFNDSDLADAAFDDADLSGVGFFGAKVGRVDFSRARNYSPLPVAIAAAGPALTELENLAQQAKRINLQFDIQRGADSSVRVGVDTSGLKYGWGIRLPQGMNQVFRRQSITTTSAAMQFLVNRVGQGKIRYETLEITSTKSPKSGKELREIVLNAIAEAFSQPLPAAAELAAATKAFREEKREKQAVDRERLKKAKEIAAKQQVTAKRQIARKIAKEVGRVTDIATFLKALELRADKSKIDKATKMLKAEKFQLFNDVTDSHLNGVVKSQTDADLVYACRIESGGGYACCTQNLNICGGLRGSICKHLLVLIIGLVKAGQLDPSTIDGWVAKTHDTKPELNKETMGEIFIRYKGAEAGEVDWRPTETVPEDYYAV